jgi:hypothetical protein
MHQQVKHITDEQVKDCTPTNIKVTPINIILPKRLPQRDANVWLTSPVKVTPQ